MGFFDVKKETQTVPPEVAACEKELAALEQRRSEVYRNIGQRYAAEVTAVQAAGTPYAADLTELEKMGARKELLEKRKLAVQGLRRCEKCGNVLSLDSAFCNKCGEKLIPLEPEVLTDGPLCPQCKSPVEPGVAFCTKCGAKLNDEHQETVQPAILKCPDCGEICEPGTRFCVKCGKALEV